jgi:hypothetical protein
MNRQIGKTTKHYEGTTQRPASISKTSAVIEVMIVFSAQ